MLDLIPLAIAKAHGMCITYLFAKLKPHLNLTAFPEPCCLAKHFVGSLLDLRPHHIDSLLPFKTTLLYENLGVGQVVSVGYEYLQAGLVREDLTTHFKLSRPIWLIHSCP